jgi:hypothetical protein
MDKVRTILNNDKVKHINIPVLVIVLILVSYNFSYIKKSSSLEGVSNISPQKLIKHSKTSNIDLWGPWLYSWLYIVIVLTSLVAGFGMMVWKNNMNVINAILSPFTILCGILLVIYHIAVYIALKEKQKSNDKGEVVISLSDIKDKCNSDNDSDSASQSEKLEKLIRDKLKKYIIISNSDEVDDDGILGFDSLKSATCAPNGDCSNTYGQTELRNTVNNILGRCNKRNVSSHSQKFFMVIGIILKYYLFVRYITIKSIPTLSSPPINDASKYLLPLINTNANILSQLVSCIPVIGQLWNFIMNRKNGTWKQQIFPQFDHKGDRVIKSTIGGFEFSFKLIVTLTILFFVLGIIVYVPNTLLVLCIIIISLISSYSHNGILRWDLGFGPIETYSLFNIFSNEDEIYPYVRASGQIGEDIKKSTPSTDATLNSNARSGLKNAIDSNNNDKAIVNALAQLHRAVRKRNPQPQS